MAISDAARRNHEALFPGHVSTLATTDQEFVGADAVKALYAITPAPLRMVLGSQALDRSTPGPASATRHDTTRQRRRS
ncbi:hypothetical protein [Spirillospora sp. NPDC047279]|uniref:hypothetical protein n=1 Tax=Spirillospora sp. NPDC047279 TaxID=3155478 RepID=UPI0033D89108